MRTTVEIYDRAVADIGGIARSSSAEYIRQRRQLEDDRTVVLVALGVPYWQARCL